ncbi:MAG TPA: C4-dicarboxylate ABC transporter permease [Deltaproteobacteria bacterium]|nr:C4-dicarboxylate ABC transporter permease [Deltaproteobacteria bacterium]
MNEIIIGIVGLFVLLLVFSTGIEIASGMMIVGFIGFGLVRSFGSAFDLLSTDLFETLSSYGLTVLPLFVLMGQVAFSAGIAKRLYDAAYKFIGRVPGCLAISTILGATLFKAICGSSPATTATFSAVAIPEMDRYGYSRKLSTGTVATSGTLGVLVPPNITLIIYGFITNQSIGKLFLAALFPGLLIALLYSTIILCWCKINPSIAGRKGEKFPLKEKLKSLTDVFWPAVIFIVTIGGLMKGFFTPTEAGSVGAFAVILLTFFKRDLNFKGYINALGQALKIACMFLLIVAGSAMVGHFLAVTKIPLYAADWMGNLNINKYIIIAFILFLYNVGGSFVDDFAFMILVTPILFPAILKLGFDPLWFGIIVCIAVMIGGIIPPVAMNVFIVKKFTKASLGEIYSGTYPFLAGLIALTILLCIFPQIVLFLPNLLMP